MFQSFPQYHMHFQVFGVVVATAALLGSAFVTQVCRVLCSGHRLTSTAMAPRRPHRLSVPCGRWQAPSFPTGSTTDPTALYYPASILVFEWFVERRGLATGIMYAGTGVGGAVFPIIISALLRRFHYRATMLILGVAFGLIAGVTCLGVKKRVPVSREIGPGPRGRSMFAPDYRFVRRWVFYVGIAIVFLTGMSSLLPGLWLPCTSTAPSIRVGP